MEFFHNEQTNSEDETYYDVNIYENGILNMRIKLVYNNERLPIAYCKINLADNTITDQRKCFYGDINIYKRINPQNGFLTVIYKNNLVETIYIYDDDYTLEEFLNSEDSNLFDWNNHPYYHNFLPMLPNTSL